MWHQGSKHTSTQGAFWDQIYSCFDFTLFYCDLHRRLPSKLGSLHSPHPQSPQLLEQHDFPVCPSSQWNYRCLWVGFTGGDRVGNDPSGGDFPSSQQCPGNNRLYLELRGHGTQGLLLRITGQRDAVGISAISPMGHRAGLRGHEGQACQQRGVTTVLWLQGGG